MPNTKSETTPNSFEEAGNGPHWLRRPGCAACVYVKAFSHRFGDDRWWAADELMEPDTDWESADMLAEGWAYLRPWSDAEERENADA